MMKAWWETASRDEILRRQDALLRRFLRERVVPFTAHYRAMFADLGLAADDIRGTDDLVNLGLSCSPCNGAKGAQTESEYLMRLAEALT